MIIEKINGYWCIKYAPPPPVCYINDYEACRDTATAYSWARSIMAQLEPDVKQHPSTIVRLANYIYSRRERDKLLRYDILLEHLAGLDPEEFYCLIHG